MLLYNPQFVLKNLDKLPVLGKGRSGTVYKIDKYKCIKVNVSAENNEREIQLYKQYSGSSLFPRMYQSGKSYIIMELIKGRSLSEHLKSGGALNLFWLNGLLEMFEEGRRIGLCLNPNARHIVLTRDNRIKLLDLEDIVKLESPKPFMLFHRLNKHDQKEILFKYVENHKRELYEEWKARTEKA